MEGAGGASGTTGPATENLDQLEALFEDFSSTLVELRTVSTEGQQNLETARTRPQ